MALFKGNGSKKLIFASTLKLEPGNFSGGPVVKTLPSSAGVPVGFLAGELRSHMPCGQKPEKQRTEAIL